MTEMRVLVFATAIVGLAACNALFGVDALQFDPEASTGLGGASDGGAGGSGGGGGGGGGEGGGNGGSGGLQAPWWDIAFTRRVRLDLDTASLGASGTVNDFPVVVRLNELVIDLADITPSAGDLRFVAADNQTVLAHELDHWTDGVGGMVWVQIPSLDLEASSEHLWLYFANTSDVTALTSDPWGDTFVTVHHFTASSENQSVDSAQALDATLVNGAQVGNGIFGGALSLDGVDDHAILPDVPSLGINDGAVRTLSTWVLATGTNQQFIWLKESGCSGWTLSITASGDVVGFLRATNTDCSNHASFSAATSDLDVRDGTWHHVAFVIDRTSDVMRLYLDGVETTTTTIATTENADQGTPFLGVNFFGFQSPLEGGLDELRIASDARSPAWFALEHANGLGLLVTFGPGESI